MNEVDYQNLSLVEMIKERPADWAMSFFIGFGLILMAISLIGTLP